MNHDNIEDVARVWSVSLGTDGQLRAEFEERLVSTIDPLAYALVISVPSDNDETKRPPGLRKQRFRSPFGNL